MSFLKIIPYNVSQIKLHWCWTLILAIYTIFPVSCRCNFWNTTFWLDSTGILNAQFRQYIKTCQGVRQTCWTTSEQSVLKVDVLEGHFFIYYIMSWLCKNKYMFLCVLFLRACGWRWGVCRLWVTYSWPIPLACKWTVMAWDLCEVCRVPEHPQRDMLLPRPPTLLQARLWEVRQDAPEPLPCIYIAIPHLT